MTLIIRSGTNANAIAHAKVLAASEPGYETDTNVLKIGDGVTAWAGLMPVGVVAMGTATLVAGAVTVANAKTTANSVIQVLGVTVGGTPGALYVAARTAGTSFQIKSTSGTDTSTVQYRVLAW
jgi:Major tropism determinant N-terminal domain